MRCILLLIISIALLSYRRPLYAYNSSSGSSSSSNVTLVADYVNTISTVYNNITTSTCSNKFVLDRHIQQFRYNYTDYKYETIHWRWRVQRNIAYIYLVHSHSSLDTIYLILSSSMLWYDMLYTILSSPMITSTYIFLYQTIYSSISS